MVKEQIVDVVLGDKIILCDLDDTLIQTQKEYNRVTNDTIDVIVKSLGGKETKEDVLAYFNQADIKNMSRFEMNYRYPRTFVEVYEDYVRKHGIKVNLGTVQKIFKMGASIFETEVGYYEGAEDFIHEVLKHNKNVIILTMGDDEVQAKRLADIGLTDKVLKVEVVQEHKDEVMQRYVDTYGAENVIMLGNSLSSDIRPALKVGIDGLHFERKTWAYDKYDLDTSNKHYHAVHSYEEILETLKNKGFLG